MISSTRERTASGRSCHPIRALASVMGPIVTEHPKIGDPVSGLPGRPMGYYI
jgi:hypothetical protein